MPRLIVLEDDGPLGKAGTQVWVDDEPEKSAPAKKTAAPKKPPAKH